MSVLTRARCKAGRHSGEWSDPDRRCRTFRTCDSCGKVEEKTLHAWGQFDYVAPDRCDQGRRCERCGSTESQVRHEWGRWQYSEIRKAQWGGEQLSSPQVRVCRRCHEAERGRYGDRLEDQG